MPPSSIQKLRTQLKVFSWTGAALLAGILIVANFVMSYVSVRWDSTRGNIFSISKGSKDILKKLDDILVVRVMFSSQLPANYRLNEKYLTDLLTEYKRASGGKMRLEYFDPSTSPKGREEAMSHGVLPVQLDVRERDRREVKECFMGVAFLYGDKKGSIPLVQDSQNLEYEITVQIKKLVDPEKPELGIVTSGGAKKFSDNQFQPLNEAVSQLYKTVDVDLSIDLPPTLKSIWIIGPTKEFLPEMVNRLKDYLARGGTVGVLYDRRDVVVTEFRTSPLKLELDPLLEFAGLRVPDGLISDPRCDRIQIRASQGAFQMINIVDYPYIPVILDMDRSHPTTKGIDAFSIPFASSIEIQEPRNPRLTYTPLARTSELSTLDTLPFNVSPLAERMQQPHAPKGPFNVAMLVEGQFGQSNTSAAEVGRLILFSSSRFIQTDYPIKQANYSLFMNMIDWSLQDEVLLQIRSKGLVPKPIKPLSDGVRVLIKTLLILFLPIASLIIGFIVWQRQKIRRALLSIEYKEVI